jgi:hypothetical protein
MSHDRRCPSLQILFPCVPCHPLLRDAITRWSSSSHGPLAEDQIKAHRVGKLEDNRSRWAKNRWLKTETDKTGTEMTDKILGRKLVWVYAPNDVFMMQLLILGCCKFRLLWCICCNIFLSKCMLPIYLLYTQIVTACKCLKCYNVTACFIRQKYYVDMRFSFVTITHTTRGTKIRSDDQWGSRSGALSALQTTTAGLI